VTDSALPLRDTRAASPVQQARAVLPRRSDLEALAHAVRDMRCLSVVGVSNTGKSALLRALTDPIVQRATLGEHATDYLFIYVDFNQMLEMSEHGFYELVLREAIAVLRGSTANNDGDALRSAEIAYTGIVAPQSAFEVPLRFSQAMAAIGEGLYQRVVFLFDEIDDPIAGIDGRVFLNLRALRDHHPDRLAYITATNRRLAQMRPDSDVGEFAELFAHHSLYLSPLNAEELAAFMQRFAIEERVTFSEEDVVFARTWAGGHPGLLEAICRVLGLLTGRPVRDRSQDWIIHRRAAEILGQDLNVQMECRKIWHDLTSAEQEALLSLHRLDDARAAPSDMESVIAKHLVVGEGTERRIFARALDDFVQRQQVARQPARQGVQVDLDSGEAWVDGAPVPTLTNLEYRLLLLLYGRLGKICDKYDVVEAVWGEEYLDEVDDARIEKLVSRLRQKIEPDVANPRYLITVRGRGYKLMSG
jgi:hypothetical protein